MGSSSSKSEAITEVVKKSVSNVLISNNSSCGQNSTATQTLTISNITSDNCAVDINTSQEAQQIPNFTCTSNSKSETDLQQEFKTELKNQAEAELKGLSGAVLSKADTNSITDFVEDVSTNISISNTATCIQNLLSNQESTIDSVKASCPKICGLNVVPTDLIGFAKLCTIKLGSSQSLIQSAVGSCISSNTGLSAVITKASTELDNSAKASNKGIELDKLVDSIGGAISSIIGSSQIIFIVIGIIVVLGVLYLISSGLMSAPPTQPQEGIFKNNPLYQP